MKNHQTILSFDQHSINSYLNNFQVAQRNLSLLIREERLLKRLRRRKKQVE